MVVSVTLTSTKKKGQTGTGTVGDQFLLLTRARFFSGAGALLAIEDLEDGTIYQTDQAFATALTALATAPDDSGAFILT